jgi:hypothetical protein
MTAGKTSRTAVRFWRELRSYVHLAARWMIKPRPRSARQPLSLTSGSCQDLTNNRYLIRKRSHFGGCIPKLTRRSWRTDDAARNPNAPFETATPPASLHICVTPNFATAVGGQDDTHRKWHKGLGHPATFTSFIHLMRAVLFLPPTTQGFIDLNEREPLVAHCLGQAQFRGKEILIGIESVEHRVHAAAKSHICQTCTIAERSHQRFALSPNLPNFLILNQCI